MSKKIKFGVVGSNFISDRVITAGRMDPRFELTALYSRTPERAAEYAAKHNIPHTFNSLEEMVSGDLVDAVYIASPNALHAPQSILCLDHGKHVLCEKPMASNAREAREMTAAARRNNRTLMEAMKPTLTPNFQKVRENLHRVGTPRRWFASFGKYSSRYDLLKGGDLPNTFNPALANGAAMDIGVYAIYPMVALFGAPEKIQSTVVMLPSGVDGHGAVNYTYPGGMIATTLYSKMVDMALPWEIEGEDGTIRGDAINSIMRLEFRQRGEGAEYAGSNALQWSDIANPVHSGNDYSYEVSHFFDLVEAGRVESDINTHTCSIAVMEIVDEIRRQSGIVYPADGI
ncbi:MAG: Gfo/Idh/MocA family oxidoreductase [Alistipes sp.]|jgi:predicted dehydrogenase|nr:Gfo/Idh/MocA family oxidoreductase [Alistipes sp.]